MVKGLPGRVLAVTVAATLLAAVMASAPAHAAIIPTFGSGWSYQSATSFTYNAWIPGAAITGAGTDLEAFTAGLIFKFCTIVGPPIMPGNDGGCVSAPRVQSSIGDPDLRTQGTGASWTYAPNAGWYTYKLQRPGVQVQGSSYHPTPTTRSVSGTVTNTIGLMTCAKGRAVETGPVGRIASASTSDPPATFYRDDFDNFDNAHLVDLYACTKSLITSIELCIKLRWGLGQPQAFGFNAP